VLNWFEIVSSEEVRESVYLFKVLLERLISNLSLVLNELIVSGRAKIFRSLIEDNQFREVSIVSIEETHELLAWIVEMTKSERVVIELISNGMETHGNGVSEVVNEKTHS
jgi:hypothetical protein